MSEHSYGDNSSSCYAKEKLFELEGNEKVEH